MDKLTKDAIQAKQSGMSYGKWKAMQEPVEQKKSLPEDWIKCEYCGKPFKPRYGKRFCDVYCRERAYAENNREKQLGWYKNYRERKKLNEGCIG